MTREISHGVSRGSRLIWEQTVLLIRHDDFRVQQQAFVTDSTPARPRNGGICGNGVPSDVS